ARPAPARTHTPVRSPRPHVHSAPARAARPSHPAICPSHLAGHPQTWTEPSEPTSPALLHSALERGPARAAPRLPGGRGLEPDARGPCVGHRRAAVRRRDPRTTHERGDVTRRSSPSPRG